MPLTDIGAQLSGARKLVERRDFGRAQQACLAVIRVDRQNGEAHFLLGVIAAEMQRFGNAIDFLHEAIALDGARSEYFAQLGRCLAMVRREQEAVAAAERAIELDAGNPRTQDMAGVIFSRAGEHTRAVDCFRKAAAGRPDDAGCQFNLASSLQFNGDFDAAETAYEAAVRISPRFYKAHSALAHLRRQTVEHNHIERLEALQAGGQADVDGNLHLAHALAKEYEDLGQYARAFEHLVEGNRRKRARVDYSIGADEALFATLMASFDESFFSAVSPGFGSSEPLFVVGMPRSGTTLVERILSSHSQVMSAGELQNFPLTVKKLSGTRTSRVLDTETVAAATTIGSRELGERYIESTRPATARLPHFVDKMPLNFLYVGLIAAALPNAKIVSLRRHAMDTCLSNFRQLFSLTFSYYNYAYDLEEIGRYFVLFDRLMTHWHRVLPGRILEVHYERLVADQENESRRLLEFCGLDWEDACLWFDRNESPVATASSAQVREPMYRTAVGRWKHYEQQLEPLRALLEAEGIDIASGPAE